MRVLVGALAALALAATPCVASAAGLTKADIAQALKTEGYDVRDFQANALAVNVSGHTVVVFVAGADGDLSYITYFNDMSINDVGHTFLSKFNSEVKFGRAYVDRDGDITIQMDRNSTGGVTIKNVQSDFDVFLMLIAKFLTDLEARPSA
jgi:hypothetical protein